MWCGNRITSVQSNGCWRPSSLHRQEIKTDNIDRIGYRRSCLTWGRIWTSCVMSRWRNDIKWQYMFLLPRKKTKNIACKRWGSCRDPGWYYSAIVIRGPLFHQQIRTLSMPTRITGQNLEYWAKLVKSQCNNTRVICCPAQRRPESAVNKVLLCGSEHQDLDNWRKFWQLLILKGNLSL